MKQIFVEKFAQGIPEEYKIEDKKENNEEARYYY